MTNKEIMRNKVQHLEQALLETSFTMNRMQETVNKLQSQLDAYKKSGDQKDLEQNNDLIINLIQKRLDKGKEMYHQNIPIMPKDDLTRDNFYEAVEEALDLSVYLSAYMLRLMEEKERNEGETTTADEHNKEILDEVKDDKTKESTA
jgi:hypothetical protein